MHADPFAWRLGLNVPNDWWPSPAMLKSFEAAGFALAQVHAPPPQVLADRHQCGQHATALRAALDTTELLPVVHAPGGLRVGSSGTDRAADGLLSYAAEIGA